MARAPCCDKMGLKKGPWSADEDQTLVAYISNYGHANWRALPKQAGLLRCGKSCRLRWTNYLRPDIKRGNFSREEEEMIVSLHEKLGNRWSAIAARLPGRTDNEIKNVWHTHIKKRLKQDHHHLVEGSKQNVSRKVMMKTKPETLKEASQMEVESNPTMSPEWSDISSMTRENNNNGHASMMASSSSQETFDIDESFWSEALSMENNSNALIGATTMISTHEPFCALPKDHEDSSMSFWLSILMEAEDLGGLPEINLTKP